MVFVPFYRQADVEAAAHHSLDLELHGRADGHRHVVLRRFGAVLRGPHRLGRAGLDVAYEYPEEFYHGPAVPAACCRPACAQTVPQSVPGRQGFGLSPFKIDTKKAPVSKTDAFLHFISFFRLSRFPLAPQEQNSAAAIAQNTAPNACFFIMKFFSNDYIFEI